MTAPYEAKYIHIRTTPIKDGKVGVGKLRVKWNTTNTKVTGTAEAVTPTSFPPSTSVGKIKVTSTPWASLPSE